MKTITARTIANAVVAVVDLHAPARWVREDGTFTGSLREPDFYDDGKAYWLTPDAVVSIDIDRTDEIESILALEPRIRQLPEGQIGWVRIHPSHYGIEVDWFNGESHDAQGAWGHVTRAIKEPTGLLNSTPFTRSGCAEHSTVRCPDCRKEN